MPHPSENQRDGANYDSEATRKKLSQVDPKALTYPPYPVEGMHARMRGPKFAEVYDQASLFYNSVSDVEREHIISAAQFELGRCDNRGVQERTLNMFNEIDHGFAVAVGEGLGLSVGEPKHKNHGRKTGGELPFSLLDAKNAWSLAGRKVAIFALDGYDSTQVTALKAGLLALGIVPQIIGQRKGPAWPKGDAKRDNPSKALQTHFTIETARSTLFDGLFFPSGDENYNRSLNLGRVVHFLREAYGHFKTIGAAGPETISWLTHKGLPGVTEISADLGATVSSQNGVVLSRNLTSDDMGVFEKLVTGPRDLAGFAPEFIRALSQHRHWGRDNSAVAF